jgi:HEAT repeat protein
MAAEALATVGRLNDALPVLIAALQHDSALIRLRALNVLDQLGQDARPALPAIQQAKPQSNGHVEDYVGQMFEAVPEKIAP